MSEKYIVLGIPHQLPAFAWAGTEEGIIEAATKQGMIYEVLDANGVRDFFIEVAHEAEEILSRKQQVVAYGEDGEVQFAPPDDCPTEFDAAKDVLSSDLYEFRVLTYGEARNFAKSYTGHKGIEVKARIKELLIE